MIGRTLSHFEITAKLGEGGMGKVYRAEDGKLGRQVAIKILPDEISADPERLARFDREARVLASLNHPHIAGIFQVERADEIDFLVLELVEGEDLAQRLARGRLPIEETVPIALQIAEGLEAAHEQGIIHRDLKPANVKVTPDGEVKILDFGLAKALGPADATVGAEDGALSPTLTAPMTRANVVLGTAAYMSPEQAGGKPVDRRSDIFSFGTVLYEMLTGKRAFAGDDVTQLLASILTSEPEWKALPSNLDPRLGDLLRRCLRKDRNSRRQSIGDVRVELQEIIAGPEAPPAGREPKGRSREVLIGALALILGMVIAGAIAWRLPGPTTPSPIRYSITTAGELPRAMGPLLALSADGKNLVYSAVEEEVRRLYSRPLDQFQTSPIAGTEEGKVPVLSPDGQWVAWATDDGLKKVRISGGTPTTVCKCFADRSATWGPDDRIFFTNASSGLSAVSAAGGTPRPVTTLEGDETIHRGVSVLPNGRAILFAALSGGRETAQINVQSLATDERQVLLAGTRPRYVQTGHLLFTRGDALWAVSFDVDRLVVSGEPMPVVDAVRQEPVGAAQFEVALDGTLVYVPSLQETVPRDSLLWVDRKGGITPLPVDQGVYQSPRVSPNGREIALQITAEDGSDNIWVLDIERGTSVAQTTGNTLSRYPVWAPDGARIAFTNQAQPGRAGLYWIALSGGEPVSILQRDESQWPSSWSRDGSLLAFERHTLETRSDIWVYSLAEGTSAPFLDSGVAESAAAFSPDGASMAYVSDESGRRNVYITSYPEPGRRTRVSRAGGRKPRWPANGRELFYLADNGEVMTVPILSAEPLEVGLPEPLFQLTGLLDYDAHPDGERFVVVRRSALSQSTEIRVVQDWFGELKRLVPSS